MYSYSFFASTYGSGTHNQTAYSSQTTANGSSTTSTGMLANTGLDIMLISSLACVLLCTGIIVRVMHRPVKKAPDA